MNFTSCVLRVVFRTLFAYISHHDAGKAACIVPGANWQTCEFLFAARISNIALRFHSEICVIVSQK